MENSNEVKNVTEKDIDNVVIDVTTVLIDKFTPEFQNAILEKILSNIEDHQRTIIEKLEKDLTFIKQEFERFHNLMKK